MDNMIVPENCLKRGTVRVVCMNNNDSNEVPFLEMKQACSELLENPQTNFWKAIVIPETIS